MLMLYMHYTVKKSNILYVHKVVHYYWTKLLAIVIIESCKDHHLIMCVDGPACVCLEN